MPTHAFRLAALTLAALALGGCVSVAPPVRSAALVPPADVADVADAGDAADIPATAVPGPGRYAALSGEPFPVPAVDVARIPDRYLRHEVAYQTAEAPGTIVIDTATRQLYYVLGGGRAMRYGVGVGKEGMSWSGVATVGVKRSWPDWYPPKEMIARRPDIEDKIRQLPSGRGLPGGVGNPLGARALYLYQDGRDTLYRIHGTLEPYTMGQAVSSGCVRMINQDAIDLFSRVEVGTRVVVLPDGPRGAGPGPVAEGPAEDAHGGVAVFPEGYRPAPAYGAYGGSGRYGYGDYADGSDGYAEAPLPGPSYRVRASSAWYR